MAQIGGTDLTAHSVQAARNVCLCKLAGMPDSAIQGLADTTAALQQAFLTYRDSVSLPQGSAGRAAFDMIYFALEVMQADGVWTDGGGTISSLSTLAASFPTGNFVAGVTTDLLSLVSTYYFTQNATPSVQPNQLGNLITPAFGLRTVFPF